MRTSRPDPQHRTNRTRVGRPPARVRRAAAWGGVLLGTALGLGGALGAASAAAEPPPDSVSVDAEDTGVWPLPDTPAVVEAFDPPPAPWLPGHRGVDLAGQVGQGVRAAVPGRVAWVGTIAGTAVVVLRHGETRTTYQPVSAGVAAGDRVRAGSVIGTLVLPGSHCFPRACLHWGWKQGERYLDPLRLVGGGPVRLLPLQQPAAVGPTPGPPSGASPPWSPEAAGSALPAGARSWAGPRAGESGWGRVR